MPFDRCRYYSCSFDDSEKREEMKKTIFGSALMICGMIAGCTEYLKHQILFAAPDVARIGVNYLLQYGGPILFVAGLVFCIAGLTERVVEEEKEEV